MRRRTLVVVSAVMAMLLGSAVAAAQDATPSAPAQQPIIPAANQCTIAPREATFFEQFLGTPAAATPAATPADSASFQMPEGEEPDRATRQGVLDTIRQVGACINAGNFLALFALYTDAYIARQAASDPLAEEDLAFFTSTPVPLESGQQVAILAIVDVRVLRDGRVAVLADVLDPFGDPPGAARILFILTKVGDRWLIDEEVELGPIDESQVGVPPA